MSTHPFDSTSTESENGRSPAHKRPKYENNDQQPSSGSSLGSDSPESFETILEGRCHCGDYIVRVYDPMEGFIMCHCNDCQIISSSHFISIVAVPDVRQIQVVPVDTAVDTADLRRYEYIVPETGSLQRRTSCMRCGTFIIAEPSSLRGLTVANASIFRHLENEYPSILKPNMEIFTSRRTPWESPRHRGDGYLEQWNDMPFNGDPLEVLDLGHHSPSRAQPGSHSPSAHLGGLSSSSPQTGPSEADSPHDELPPPSPPKAPTQSKSAQNSPRSVHSSEDEERKA